MFFFDIITKIDGVIVVGIIVSHNFFSDCKDIFTSPMSGTFITSEWVIFTEEWFRFWAPFSSPFVFSINDTVVDFTSINSSVLVVITVEHDNFIVVRFDIITKIELTITVGIIVSHNFSSNINDISTVPSTITIWHWFEWTVTVDSWVSFWTGFISPSVFTFDDTGVDFTWVEGTIIVEITIFKEDIVMFSFNGIFWVNGIISVGIIVGNNFFSDIFNFFTIPFTWAFFINIWVLTMGMTIIWTVFISPFIFTLDNTVEEFIL